MKTKTFWRRGVIVVGILLGTAQAIHAETTGEEGQRAYRDLAVLYEKGTQPPYPKALDDLAGADAAKRAAAAQYLLALLRQSLADEQNGRAEWVSQPFWGGGAESRAHDFRKTLAVAFGEKARGEEALEPMLWLSEHEDIAESAPAAAKVLPRIDSPRMEKVLADLLAQPHPSADLTIGAINEAGRRKLIALAPRIRELCGSYRESVRTVARKTAPALDIHDVADFKPADAFSPWLIAQFDAIRRMVPTPVPATAEWFDFEHTDPRTTQNGKPWVRSYSGWLLEDKGDTWEVLTWFGETVSLPKTETKRTARKLPDVAREIAKLQSSRDGDAREKLSPRGGLTAQFEPSGLSLPAGLVAVWCFERGEREAAAAVLFPCFNKMPDDRWFPGIMRSLLGQRCHEAMLKAFSYALDYPRTIALADHLSQPVFNGYNYQERAQKLAVQLRARVDDFNAFTLPTPDEWAKLRATLPRAEQIKFLATRLRLLHCYQPGQPASIDYADPQLLPDKAGPGKASLRREGIPVINPYVELRTMKLTPAELSALVPMLDDENFLPTFSYWRDFHPDRTLHQVNWVVAAILNNAAKRDLVQFRKYQHLDEAGRKKHLADIIAWCDANAAKSQTDLLLETMRQSKEWREFFPAAGQAVQAKVAGTLPVLVERIAAFPEEQGKIAELVYQTADPETAGPARQWLKSDDDELRFWAALILLRHGNGNEGLAELKTLLAKDTDLDRYAMAVEPLVTRKDEASLALACGILKKKDFLDSFLNSEVLLWLIRTGRKEVQDFFTKALDDSTETGNAGGDWQGKYILRMQVHGDRAAWSISSLRSDAWDYEILAPPKERAAKRAELKRWLIEQFTLIRAGKPAAFKDPRPIRIIRWQQIDAP